MEKFEEYKDRLLAYLKVQQSLEIEDIEAMASMSNDEKIEAGLLIDELSVTSNDDDVYILHTEENYSKMRAGDKVKLRAYSTDKITKAVIQDINIDTITIRSEKELDKASLYVMEEESPNLLQSLIGCLEQIVPATPGAAFLRMLCGEIEVEAEDFLRLYPEEIPGYDLVFNQMNEEQKDAVRSMLQFWPIHVLQGPPGTGKTQVLAATAIASSLMDREVVIIANTHHAVNNALLKIHKLNSKLPIFKIGEELKAEELGNAAMNFSKFTDYNQYCKENRRRKRYGHIVGMTIWGAINHLGLHSHSHFRPYIALVDEASLMPLTYASILGKCAPSICLFGDSRQMAPIFRPELAENPLSVSILDYASNIASVNSSVLCTTYRMNQCITQFVSRHFYEPHGIKLRSENLSDYGSDSLCWIDTYSLPKADLKEQESNSTEAKDIAKLVWNHYVEHESFNDIAVITPWRKQVNVLRCIIGGELISQYGYCGPLPLIDTVERLQGQDVDTIILSFATTDNDFFNQKKNFIMNPNRLNVMISRAKSHVFIYCPEFIWNNLINI